MPLRHSWSCAMSRMLATVESCWHSFLKDKPESACTAWQLRWAPRGVNTDAYLRSRTDARRSSIALSETARFFSVCVENGCLLCGTLFGSRKQQSVGHRISIEAGSFSVP